MSQPVSEEIPVIAKLRLCVQHPAVQATGKIMGTLVLQERARWLKLANLLDRQKDDILDMPIVPEGIFGSSLASMQQCCEAKKKVYEVLQLCLLWKVSGSPPMVQCKEFTPGPQALPLRVQKHTKPAPAPPVSSGRASWANAPSFSADCRLPVEEEEKGSLTGPFSCGDGVESSPFPCSTSSPLQHASRASTRLPSSTVVDHAGLRRPTTTSVCGRFFFFPRMTTTTHSQYFCKIKVCFAAAFRPGPRAQQKKKMKMKKIISS